MKDGRSAARDGAEKFLFCAAQKLKEALYPEGITCDLCGTELVADTRYTLCADCLAHMPFAGGHRCLVCGVPISDEADYCLRCQATESVFLRNVSPLIYEGRAKELVYALKFGKKKYIARLLGAMMSDAYIGSGAEAEIAVPVPMSASELKKRGFNQSALLADEAGGRLHMPVLPALVKVRETMPQKELSGKARAENVKGCFAAAYGDYVKGRKILLVDDVFTTGATANECARTLLKAKARSVTVLTAAVAVPQNRVEPGSVGRAD